MPWVNTVPHRNWPAGPFGFRKWSMSSAQGFLSAGLAPRPALTKKMLEPLMVQESSSAAKAVLFELSSQLRPRSSKASFHSPTTNLTASSVSFELMVTVLPSASSFLPSSRYSSQVSGGFVTPAWLNQLLRYTDALGSPFQGMP